MYDGGKSLCFPILNIIGTELEHCLLEHGYN
jgi:hypothetical protein